MRLLLALLIIASLLFVGCSAEDPLEDDFYVTNIFAEQAGSDEDNIETAYIDTLYVGNISTDNINGVSEESGESIASISTENRDIYVSKEARGENDGTSWADAYTTIMDAVDSLPDTVANDYTITIRHGTKKLGTADSDEANKLADTGEFSTSITWVGRRVFNVDGTADSAATADGDVANHLQDDTNSPFIAGDVGRTVHNTTDSTFARITAVNDAGDITLSWDCFPNGNEEYYLPRRWGIVAARDDNDTLSIKDVLENDFDLFPNGNESYVIEPTPYRETLYLNSAPETHPSKYIIGSLSIEAEYYWYAGCDAQVNQGEILDADADFSNVELGDTVLVWDRTGTNNRMVDYELGYVDDLTDYATGILGTSLSKTPTANWYYVIIKTEVSGSDDGYSSGVARSYIISTTDMRNTSFSGILGTWSSSYAAYLYSGSTISMYNCIFKDCFYGLITDTCILSFSQLAVLDTTAYGVRAAHLCKINCFNFITNCDFGIDLRYTAESFVQWFCLAGSEATTRGIYLRNFSGLYATYGTILASVSDGITAYHNSCLSSYRYDNNSPTPETPAGTSDNPYIQ